MVPREYMDQALMIIFIYLSTFLANAETVKFEVLKLIIYIAKFVKILLVSIVYTSISPSCTSTMSQVTIVIISEASEATAAGKHHEQHEIKQGGVGNTHWFTASTGSHINCQRCQIKKPNEMLFECHQEEEEHQQQQ